MIVIVGVGWWVVGLFFGLSVWLSRRPEARLIMEVA